MLPIVSQLQVFGPSWAQTSTHLFQHSTFRWQPRKVFPPPLRHTSSSCPSRICQPMHTGNNPCNWQWPYGTWLYLSLLQPCYLWPFPLKKHGALFLQPSTSAHPYAESSCKPHLFYSLPAVQRSNWCALLRIFTEPKTSSLKASCVLDITW